MATRGSEPARSPEEVEPSQEFEQTASSGSPSPTCSASSLMPEGMKRDRLDDKIHSLRARQNKLVTAVRLLESMSENITDVKEREALASVLKIL